MSEFKPFEFETIMRNENFIVRDHRVHHVRIMPGVTFLDMIWRLLKREGFPLESLALRNVVFKEAVSTTEAYDKRIRISLQQENGRSIIRCKSLKVKEGRALDNEWDDNFQCELAQVKRPLSGRLDVAAMKEAAQRVMDIEEMYATAREVQIHHYEFMKTNGKIYITPTDFMAEVNLSDLATQYLPSFFIHPAILDTATFIPFLLHNYGPDPKPYIPLFIEAFRATRGLTGTCYIHAPRNIRLETELAHDVNFSDLGLFDSNGELVAVLKKLTEKQIRGEGLIKRLTEVEGKQTVAAAPVVAAQPAPAAAPVAATPAVIPDGGSKLERITNLLCELIAPLLGKSVGDVDCDEGFYEQGLESTDLLKVVNELESRLKLTLYPTLLFEYTTVNELAGYLAEETSDALMAQSAVEAVTPAPPAVVAAPVKDKRGYMVSLLQGLIAPLLGKSADQVDTDEGFYEQGLESTDLLKVVNELERGLKLSLYPTLLFEYTTVNELAGYLAEEVRDEVLTPAEGQPVQAAPVQAAPVAAVPVDDGLSPRERILQTLKGEVASRIGQPVDQVPTDEGFYEMGLESTDLLELVRALEERIGDSLYPTLLFEYTNIDELAGFLEDQYAAAFASATPAVADTAVTPTLVANETSKSEVVRATQVWSHSLLEAHGMRERIGKAKSILVFERSDASHFSKLKERLVEQGFDVPIYRVKVGRSYRQQGDTFALRPQEIADYRAMLKALVEADQLPDAIAILWTKEEFSDQPTTFRNQVNQTAITWQLLTQALMAHKPKTTVRLLHAYRRPNGATLPVVEGLMGFARSLRLENPKFAYRTVAVDDAELDLEQILIDEWCAQDNPEAVFYNDQGRHVRSLQALDEVPGSSPLQEGGVYLITGGLGGLGLIFAEYLAKSYKAKLVLTGRREPDEDKRAKIEELNKLGASVMFVASDISQAREVDALAVQVQAEFGTLNGVIHAAGVLRDGMLMRKSLDDLEQVMAAKVFGTMALGQLLDRFELDFMALFSSTTAVSGTAGQTDYAYANTFMDAFADQYSDHKTKVVAVNWPLWRDGGMQVDDAVLEALEKQEGMRPMEVATGLACFEEALCSANSNYIVIGGIARRICEVFGLPVPEAEAVVEPEPQPTVAQQAASPDYDFGAYQAPGVVAPPSATRPTGAAAPGFEDVAVIGVAGRYPKAEDVRAFWDNLKAGLDCIEEIPAERWHHGSFFNEDKNSEGTAYSKWGGFLDKVDLFDPLFFNIAPKEAELMEPQERLFLQTAWHTLEDAGYARSQLNTDNVGVYVGVMWGQYQLLGLEGNLRGHHEVPHPLYATIANRVSYCLNLRGPSMALDTMCSSSLTTIHLACQAIQKGECDLAIAGGVNLTLHPVKYTYLSQEKMLSTDGRCRSFGEGGDGYVPGEGVGAVLLKPLSQALADGDFIYATIKGSTLNHGGRTSGYSVPDPNAQARLVQAAFRNAGVKPQQFSYLETHGTGTALGDPIEITGMGKAFKDSGMPAKSLAIGSVKSNVGHLESAAGIAGVTKILLQMKHRQLVPSLHSAELNVKIPFERTPFLVQQDLADWDVPKDAAGRPMPRIAGVSSFGAGGSNAHIVFEEAPQMAHVVSNEPQLFVLSAKNSERLQTYAQVWLDFLDRGYLEDRDLVRIAWTMQVGREALNHRVAMVINSLNELRLGLEAYVSAASTTDRVVVGKASKNAAAAALQGQGSDALKDLAQAWVSGAKVDFRTLHAVQPQRMPLPLYPFAEERYWLPGSVKPEPRLMGGGSERLHPLITHNISTYYRLRFVAEMQASDFVFADHNVAGRGLLPGVVYLELARAAGAIAMEEEVRHLADIAFEAPLWAPQAGSVKLFIDMEPSDFGLHVVMRSEDAEEGRVHFQCLIAQDEAPDIPALPAELFTSVTMSHGEAYGALEGEGFHYGEGFRSITQIYAGDKALGLEVQLPQKLSGDFDDYGLHPALLDGLLQSVIGLDEANGGAPENVPYMIGDLYFLRPMTASMRGVLRANFDPQSGPDEKPYDGVLYDADGQPAVALFNSVLKRQARAAKPMVHAFVPYFDAQEVAVLQAPESLLLIGEDAALGQALNRKVHANMTFSFGDRFQAEAQGGTLAGTSVDAFKALFDFVKQAGKPLDALVVDGRKELQAAALLHLYQGLMQARLTNLPKLIVVCESDGTDANAVASMLRSLHLESLRFCPTLVGVEARASADEVAQAVLSASQSREMEVAWTLGARMVRRWKATDLPAGSYGLSPGQTVLITGGLGGLGLIFAEYLAKEEAVNLVLLNRSPLNDKRRAQVDQLKAHGVDVLYLAADISDRAAVKQVVDQARQRFGGIHGVIHSAGVLRDGLALRKSDDDWNAVLAAKVSGTLNLDAALQSDDLKFMLLFSSVAAAGSEGQCDYAYANGFLNGFAQTREARRAAGEVKGRTVSIGWPLWADGGMSVGADDLKTLEREWGMLPLMREDGLKAAAQLIASDAACAYVIYGDRSRMQRRFQQAQQYHQQETNRVEEASQHLSVDEEALRAGIEHLLAQAVAGVTKIDQDQIEFGVELEDYGIDSIMVMSLTEKFSETFGEVSKTLLYEFTTLQELADFFLREHRDVLIALFGNDKAAVAVAMDESVLQKGVRKLLLEMLSAETKVPVDQIEVDEQLENYGIDSIMTMGLTEQLSEIFGEVSKTLLYEFTNLQELESYFLENHRKVLMEHFSDQGAVLTQQVETKVLEKAKPKAKTPAVLRPRFQKTLGRRAVSDEPIAIVGMAGQFPQAEDLNAFWQNLLAGMDCITYVPEDRWDRHATYYGAKERFQQWGGFIDGIDQFDPYFFNMSPREASLTDPQERLFLQTVYHTLEDAGYSKTALANKMVGVYVGVMWGEYSWFGMNGGATPDAVYASIANRTSYWFDFRGPSMALDTMCSSSLTAIHLACRSLLEGETEYAIAGGVNITSHPYKYKILAERNFPSSDGRCRAFGEGGDGYVPGEGVGAVMLKRLSQAVADGDHIYGCLIATALNHGGKSNGFTVPNPASQGEVIAAALTRAKVDPKTINYVEAHGTGTSLGDPIEIAGLKRAFKDAAPAEASIAIGSVKSNIGHTESSAAVAGLIKIMLQMKHRQLVPSLHAETLNPDLGIEGSPFCVQRELSDWRGVDGAPLRASLSSFGAGGANAHLVVEAYEREDNRVRRQVAAPWVFVLTATNETSLRQYAQRFAAFLSDPLQVDLYEADLVFTLLEGRELFEQRVVILFRDVEELRQQITAFLDGKKANRVFAGNTRDAAFKTFFKGSERTRQQIVKVLLDEQDWDGLAELVAQGFDLEWSMLYGDIEGRRISLPLYPFEKLRCWVPDENLPLSDSESGTFIRGGQATQRLHPLITHNISSLYHMRFVADLNPNAFYFADHVVDGRKLLPGVAYLEMVRAAGALAFESQAISIADLTWHQPLWAEAGVEQVKVFIEVEVVSESALDVRIVSGDMEGGQLHASCSVYLSQQSNEVEDVPQGFNVDASWMNGQQIYQSLADDGFVYGPAFTSVQHLKLSGEQLQSVIQMPEVARQSAEGFSLHPGLIDGVLQSLIGFDQDDPEAAEYMPYGIGKVETFGSVSDRLRVAVQRQQAAPDQKVYEAKVYNEGGQLCLAMTGITLKRQARKSLHQLHYYEPVWSAAEIVVQQALTGTKTLLFSDDAALQVALKQAYSGDLIWVSLAKSYRREGDHITLADVSGASFNKLFEDLKAQQDFPHHIIWAWPFVTDASADVAMDVLHCFQALQTLVGARGVKFVALSEALRKHTSGLAAMLRSLHLESPRFAPTLLAANLGTEKVVLARQVVAELSAQDMEVRQAGAGREVRQWQVCSVETTEQDLGLVAGDTVLITGGLGGLGWLFAQHLAQQHKTNLVLLNRSPINAARQDMVDQLTQMGVEVRYVTCDISQATEVKRVVAEARETFGAIHGVIHAAGVLRDRLAMRKTAQDVADVFAAKVYGTDHLDEALADEEQLKFFTLFTSVSAVGSDGQCDYAFANNYQNAFAEAREQRRLQGLAHGKTVACGWPFWADGGMQVSADILDEMYRDWGMKPLAKDMGLQAFGVMLKAGLPQALVVYGDGRRLERRLAKAVQHPALSFESVEPFHAAGNNAEIVDKGLRDLLLQVLSDEIQLDPSRINPESDLEDYGIDSVMIINLTTALEKTFGDLSKTLFFEYRSLSDLEVYFKEAHHEQLQALFDKDSKLQKVMQPQQPVKAAPAVMAKPKLRMLNTGKGQSFSNEPIAIVGMAGRFPMAHDLDAFWANLQAGLDCISEVPASRWDKDALMFGNDKPLLPYGGFLEGIDEFDPLFFNMSPREAVMTDPQERLFLETVHQAVEDSGYTRSALANKRIGVYVGIMWAEYAWFGLQAGATPSAMHAAIANRVSYWFDFNGPSVGLDTMCSSSLTAIHFACQALREGKLEMGVAGGVNLSTHPLKYKVLQDMNFPSSDGRCRSFGEGGDGYVPSEGVGAILLKRLSDAVADGDNIHAVLRATALNHGGKTNGFTVPNPKAQGNAILEALEDAKIDPATISYIEAHGTGTALGDPIEIAGLKRAFKGAAVTPGSIALGSVKSNIGHGESAAGIAGLLKILMQMKHRMLVPSLHSEVLNPDLGIEGSPFQVQQALTPWVGKDQAPLRAGLSSYGAGGSNAHIIVEHFEQSETRDFAKPNKPWFFVLSAKNQDRLNVYVDLFIEYLKAKSSAPAVPDTVKIQLRLIEILQEAFATVLDVSADSLDPSDNPLDWGMDAIQQQAVDAWLKREWNRVIPTSLWDAGSIEAMAGDWAESDRDSWFLALDMKMEAGTRSVGTPAGARTDIYAGDLVFTLMYGRELMDQRLVVLFNDLDELFSKLKAFKAGKKVNGGFTANAREASTLEFFKGSERAKQQLLNVLLEEQDWLRLAMLVAQGLEVDWSVLYGSVQPRRISLPTYPFYRERYWVPEAKTEGEGKGVQGVLLHPLVTHNLSSLYRMRFGASLKVSEFYFADHVVGGKRLLPGVAYLEMARAAAAFAFESEELAIHDLVWQVPLFVEPSDQMVQVFIDLESDQEDLLDINISSGEEGRERLHATCRVQLLDAHQQAAPLPQQGFTGLTWDSERVYGELEASGFVYGPSFRSVNNVVISENRLVVTASLPQAIGKRNLTFGLHPALMDSVLQAMVGFDHDRPHAGDYIPYGIGYLEQISPLGVSLTAVLESTGEQDDVRSFNATVYGEMGQACLVVGDLKLKRQKRVGVDQLHLFQMDWERHALDSAPPLPVDTVLFSEDPALHLALASQVAGKLWWVRKGSDFSVDGTNMTVGGTASDSLSQVFKVLKDAGVQARQLVWAWPLSEASEATAFELLHAFQAMHKPGALPATKLLVVSGDDIIGAAITGILRSFHMEAPKLLTASMVVQASLPKAQLAQHIVAELAGRDSEIRYVGAERQLTRWNAIEIESVRSWDLEPGQTVIITGGLGGLGWVFAKDLATVYKTNLVLVNRSPINDARQRMLDELEGHGIKALYVSCDIADREQVQQAVDQARNTFGPIHGVIHSAGVLRDGLALRKSDEDMQTVFASKVAGVRYLDEALDNEASLKWFALFASVSALGSAGQCDYAFANAFLNGFAAAREARRVAGQAFGKSLSLCWPYWAEGGMQVSEEDKSAMYRELGMRPLETEDGLQAFGQLLACEANAAVVIFGDGQRISRHLKQVNRQDALAVPKAQPVKQPTTSQQPSAQPESRDSSIQQGLRSLLLNILADQIQLDASRIDPKEELETYGIDSVMVLNLTESLSQTFGELSKTLLFEYRTLEELEAYFLEDHQTLLAEKFASTAPKAAEVEKVETSATPQVARPRVVDKPRRVSRGVAKAATFDDEPIAIVGMAGRFPKADDLDAFWSNLQAGLDCISEVPKSRWDKDADYFRTGEKFQQWGGFMDGIDQFDPYFFNMTPRETILTDPQERLFLETVHQLVENAGYARSSLARKKVGVYAGVMWGEYAWFGLQGGLGPGVLFASIANRVSYWFDFKGPSMGLDTMCSSGLTAIHLACQNLREGKMEIGIAGGVNVCSHPYKYKLLKQMKFPSSDGRCRAFGAGGDGYVPAEGVGAIMLKRLSQAEADGDHIYGVLRATAINHGGKTNGFTVPNPAAQGEIIAEALAASGVDPATVSYVEAHGTGTALGDPIEIAGLKRAFKGCDAKEASIAIGSVKSNIGHCESTAGLAGIIKVLLQMKHRKLVPSLHAETLNPDLGIDGSPFRVQRELSDWQVAEGTPLRAGLSSFGAGGSNAHMVIENYRPQPKRSSTPMVNTWLFLLSAQSEDRLQAYVQLFIQFLQQEVHEETNLDSEALKPLVVAELLKGFATILGIPVEDLDASENPIEWGFDPVKQGALRSHLGQALGVAVPKSLWTQATTLQMADLWLQHEASALQAALQDHLPAVDFETSKFATVRDGIDIADLVFTLMHGREPMVERLALVFESIEDLVAQLKAFTAGSAKNLYRANVQKSSAASFLSGNVRAKDQFLAVLLEEQDWDRIAELWTQGVSLEWETLYTGVEARRMPLPTYPFDRGSYWVPQEGFPVPEPFNTPILANPDYVILNKQWQPQPSTLADRVGPQRIVILCATEMQGLAEQLFAQHTAVETLVMVAGRDFDAADPATSITEWRQQWSELPTVLLDLIDLGQGDDNVSLGRLRVWQDVLGEFRVQPFTLLHVTQHRVHLGDQRVNLKGSVAAAMARVLAAEVRTLQARTVDVDSLQAAALSQQLLQEIGRNDGETEVAYRRGVAYLPSFVERHRRSEMVALDFPLAKDKCFIITGGTRGIGAAIAAHLVNLGVENLVLVGRSGLPDRVEWQAFIQNQPDAQVTQKIQMVMALEQRGAKVEVRGVDLSSKASLQSLKDECTAQFGTIGTLIHCAGLPSDDPPSFVKKDLNDMARVLQPKVGGLQLLLETFADDQLEALILISSMSAQLPQVASGAADYAAANAFMDDFASYARQQGTTTYSIQFPNWIETGMGEVKSPAAERFGIQGLRTLEGLHLFELSLQYKDAVSLPLKMVTQNVATYDELHRGLSVQKAKPQSQPTATAPQIAQTAVAASARASDFAMEWIRDLLVRELRFDKDRLTPETEFGDIGVDSVMIAELVTFVEDWLGTKFDPSLFLEYPTPQSLGSHIAEVFADQLRAVMGDAAPVAEAPAAPVTKPAAPPVAPPPSQSPKPRMQISTAKMGPQRARFAIIGVGCNLPGGPDPQPFWDMLISGNHAVREIPELRWDWRKLYHPEHMQGRSISKWGAFLDGIDYFDPEYFKLSPDEGESLDPLIRQVLESSAKAVANAGYENKELSGKRVGVFVGSRIGNWNDRLKGLQKNTIAATEQNFIAAHVSHFLNLKGPNLMLDCACSSSLMTLHLACQSILTGDSEMALAGGSDILLEEGPYLALSEGRALSPDGRCHTFDEAANGFVPGEGSGMVLIKALDRAISDGDQIYAVIESSAANNDGRTMGITTPNPEMQVDVIQHALDKAQLTADQISYMECHGTGTKIGDPIELKALTRVFRQYTQENQFCAVGSVKTNIGHLLSAAGIAGVIKLILSIQNKQLPPTLNCNKPNPRFEFESSPFYPNLKAQAWQPRFGRRIAGISGFGFGGTNVHILLSDGDPDLMAQYIPQRHPLPAIAFNKRRFWLEKLSQNIYAKPSESPNSRDENKDSFKPFAELEFV